ncbi:hypothetical protein [Bosea vestrisii]|uniref:Uncharacterized protein n=1 Tax=Bosea vestrisii TaxID=151416 RepID=A0ABW0H745_9HYPH
MARSAAQLPVLVPLFQWRDVAALAELERERQALKARIDTLPRCSHRRIVLAARLQDLTHRHLAMLVELRRTSP